MSAADDPRDRVSGETAMHLGLSATAREVYLYAASNPGLDRAVARDRLGLPYDEVDTALAALEAARLIRRTSGDPSSAHASWVAVAPELAATSLLAEHEEQVARLSLGIAESRAQYLALLPGYLDSRAGSYSEAGIEVIETGEEVNTALSRIIRETQRQCWCAHPGNGLNPENVRTSWKNDQEMMARGVELRSILQHSTRTQLGAQRYAALAIPAGAKIRTIPLVPARTLIYDGELAFLSRFVDGRPKGALLIRDPDLVGYLIQVYEATWSLAQDFPVDVEPAGSDAVLDDTSRAVLALLAAGHKDEVIARRLGCSVRTARRHVSAIMETLEAESRFQAGVRAAQAGWLDA